ncbi:hypothetical protein RGR602_PC01242 (plasmid) [Rhizobium gallicum bv. gallicum R602sp]|uniref:Uncharacterized protein n=1 Tax=Rhizobium gallicum bv. gallicum R602sp TaxID=1041138 RepID=A0A0B4XES4_9HYPH|nr:hypothetical protein RGR602_PC01242 [Rhizobium gallicum bv. gallicum R602sp]
MAFGVWPASRPPLPVYGAVGLLFLSIFPAVTAILPGWWGSCGWFFRIGGAIQHAQDRRAGNRLLPPDVPLLRPLTSPRALSLP